MVDIHAALQFVESHGQPHHIALARYAVGAADAQAVITALTPHQRENGGWTGLDPDCPTELSTLSCTWIALQYLRWMSADNDTLTDRTGDFLAAVQHADGYWDEPDAIQQYNPPPWMQPGKAPVRMWLTAAITRMMVETGQDTKIYMGRALTYLSQQLEAGTLNGRGALLHPLWMMLPLFKRVGQKSDQHIVDACQVRLLGAVLFEELDPLDVAAVAHAALNARYAGNQLYIAARDKVLEYQQADGGWCTNYGETHRPNATVDALMLIRLAGLL